MANNLAMTLLHSILLLIAAANPLAFGNTYSCPDDFTVYGNVPIQEGATLAPGYGHDPARAVAFFVYATAGGAGERIGRSTIYSDGSFNITVSQAKLSNVNLNQTTAPCAIHVRLSSTTGFLGSGLRRCDYEACQGVTCVTRCVADKFDDILLPCEM